jgi:hypothetical protein
MTPAEPEGTQPQGVVVMRRSLCSLSVALLVAGTATAAEPLGPETFADLLKAIKPDPTGPTWLQIPWQTSLAAARAKAAAEGKPVLLWEMDGNPLGCG